MVSLGVLIPGKRYYIEMVLAESHGVLQAKFGELRMAMTLNDQIVSCTSPCQSSLSPGKERCKLLAAWSKGTTGTTYDLTSLVEFAPCAKASEPRRTNRLRDAFLERTSRWERKKRAKGGVAVG